MLRNKHDFGRKMQNTFLCHGESSCRDCFGLLLLDSSSFSVVLCWLVVLMATTVAGLAVVVAAVAGM